MGRNKKRRVKHIVMHQTPKNVSSIEKRLSTLEEKLTGLLSSLVPHLGDQQVKTEILIESFDRMDVNVLSLVHVCKEVFGQLSQIDEMLKLVDPATDGKTLDERVDTEHIKSSAEAWFKEVVASAISKVLHDRAENKKKREEEAKAAEKAKEEDDAVRAEAAVAEAALKEAEDPAAVRGMMKDTAVLDEAGSFIPEGAQVFGG
jgi:hypothetical protein